MLANAAIGHRRAEHIQVFDGELERPAGSHREAILDPLSLGDMRGEHHNQERGRHRESRQHISDVQKSMGDHSLSGLFSTTRITR